MLEPPANRVVVVRPRVGDAVPCDVVGSVRVPRDVAGEAEYQDLHPREPEVGHHLMDVGSDVAKVLGDDGEARPAPHKQGEEVPAGRIDPAPVLRGRLPGGDLPELHEPPEVIEAQPVDESEGAVDPALPPRKSPLAVRIPVVDRVSPELPGRAEHIRGDARDCGRFLLFVQFEEPGVRPEVDAIVGEVDRYIPDDLDGALAAMVLERLPLPIEDVLEELLPEDQIRELRAVAPESVFVPVPDIGRPVAPDLPGKPVLEGDEDGVVVEPRGIVGDEFFVAEVLPEFFEPRKRPVEEAVLVGKDRGVVDPPCGEIGWVPDILRPEEAVCDHLLGADEPGVPGKRRDALVGRVAERRARRVEGKDLPVALPGTGEEVYEPVRRRTEVADPVGRRQGRYVEEDPAAPPVHARSLLMPPSHRGMSPPS
ncbi:hypothetical protein DSECCO2_499720 [anaerobic digester metagenome]